MKYQLSDGNIIIATQDYIDSLHPDAVPVEDPEVPVVPTPIVPQVVTMRQARLALLQAGLLDDVESVMNSLPEPDRSAAHIEWNYSSEVHRNKPFVKLLGQALDLDDDAIDQLFITAEAID